jgi:hypothetical protein
VNTTHEAVVGYDTDGHRHEVDLVDGRYVPVTEYVIDPDELIGNVDVSAWLAHQYQRAAKASPLAAAWIRLWAAQTAQERGIDLDIEPDEPDIEPDA